MEPNTEVKVGYFYKHYNLKHTVRVTKVWPDAVQFNYMGREEVYLMEDFIRDFDPVSVEPMQ